MQQDNQETRQKASARERFIRLAKSPAVILATLLLLAGAYFGSNRDFGLFLLSILILPVLFLAALAATAWAGRRKAARRRVLLAAALILLTPLAYLWSYGIVQRVRFLIWAPAHYRELLHASRTNGVITGWDSWGIAGADNFSYLVVDTGDRLGSAARGDQWTKQIGQSCGLWKTQKMWPKLYVVTTYTNCPYDGVQPAN